MPALIQLLSHRQPHVRWEAAKALGAVADPIAAFALVNALKDATETSDGWQPRDWSLWAEMPCNRC